MSEEQWLNLEDEPVVIELQKRPWLETLKDNPLMGATTHQLLLILYRFRGELDVLTFFPRIALLFFISLFNSFFAAIDSILFSQAISEVELPLNPVFIIGQPRSGTTLVHNLLSLDEQFVTPNTFQVGWPSSFLTMERFAGCWPLSKVLSSTRPMDNLPLNWATPMEDEIATNVLSSGASPYMAILLMRAHRTFLQFISFDSPNALNAFRRWRSAFLFFCRKVVLKAKPGQRLLLKSPCHTGRVALLNALFKGTARFVFVHRAPQEVFQSSHAALVQRYIRPCASLQTFQACDAQQYILGQGTLLHRLFMKESSALPQGRIAIVAFHDLVRDPWRTVEDSIYDALHIPMSSEVRARLQEQVAQIKGFQQNSFPQRTVPQKALVRRQWSSMFTDLGYVR